MEEGQRPYYRACLRKHDRRGKAPTVVNIKLHFLPPNTKSLMQLMDMGVNHNLNVFYWSRLNIRILTALDADTTALVVSRSVTILDSLYILRDAWISVKQVTIRNCFKKGGFGVLNEVKNVELVLYFRYQRGWQQKSSKEQLIWKKILKWQAN